MHEVHLLPDPCMFDKYSGKEYLFSQEIEQAFIWKYHAFPVLNYLRPSPENRLIERTSRA